MRVNAVILLVGLAVCRYISEGKVEDSMQSHSATEHAFVASRADNTSEYVVTKGAARELRKSAEAGSAEAQYMFGMLYHEGLGVQQNPSEARRWLRKSVAQGHAKARAALKE